MSNVLIGIIGVILFIGLALAGALFLGPRFQQATLNSKGAALSQAVAQISAAANMYRVQEGRGFSETDDLYTLVPGYLKAMPSNPTGYTGANGVHLVSRSFGMYDPGNPTPGEKDLFVVMRIGGEVDTAREICGAINRQAGINDPDIDSFVGTNGCMHSPHADDFVYYAYSAV